MSEALLSGKIAMAFVVQGSIEELVEFQKAVNNWLSTSELKLLYQKSSTQYLEVIEKQMEHSRSKDWIGGPEYP